MAVAGRKPKPDGQRINHVPPTHDWTDVVDAPYRGRHPQLPKGSPPATRAWWNGISAMPHCILWRATDWRFALDTARIHAQFINGDMARAAELRLREREMGTTADARRDLRIRYVEAAPPDDLQVPDNVTALRDDRRLRIFESEK